MLAGRLDRRVIDSALLRGSPLGDPHERPLWVYTPPGYADPGVRYPAVYVLQGYSGHVAMWANRTPFRQPFIETADAVFASGAVPPCLVVYVDAIPDRESRAVSGKSSGGFGAMITPMLRPDVFGALATHAGDSGYEYVYIGDFGKAVRALREYGGDIHRWWDDFRSRTAFTKEADQTLVMVLGCAAAFAARDDGTPELPFDPRTGELPAAVWERWLAWDPVRMVDRYADALRSLRAVWIDAGTRDEWFLDLGAEAFRAGLDRIGVAAENVHFAHFDAGHLDIEYRYPISLAWLAARLAR